MKRACPSCGRKKCKNEHVESFSVEGLWAMRNALWPTPTASAAANRTKRSRPSETDGRGHGRTLAGAVFSWPTPTVGGTGFKSGNKKNVWRPTLKSAAMFDAKGVHPSKWPTPVATRQAPTDNTRWGGQTLAGAVSVNDLWPTPTTNRATYGRRHGKISPTLRGLGQLNPSFVQALMGFPAGWVD